MSSLRSISKEQFYEIIKEWADKNGRSPTKEDFENDNELPSPRTLEENKKIHWNTALKEIGLEQIKDKSYYFHMSNEELFDAFKDEYFRINAKTIESFNENKSSTFPRVHTIEKRLGKTFSEIKKIMGIDKKDIRTSNISKKDYIKMLQDLAEELKHSPSVSEFNATGRSSTGLIRKFNMTYNDIITLAGLDPMNEKNIDVKETKEELLQMYIDFSLRIGKPASFNDLCNSSDIYNGPVFTLRFGGMNELKSEAFGLEPRGENRYTFEEVEGLLMQEHKRFGRRLTAKETYKNSNLPGILTILRYYKETNVNNIWDKVESKLLEEKSENDEIK